MFGGVEGLASGLPATSTSCQRRARISSVRAPVSNDTMTYARIRGGPCSAAFSNASAWINVSDLDGRPVRPSGTSHSRTMFRRILSRT